MKVQKLNSSSRRTDKAIKQAFAELIKEKNDLNKITVTELVKRADITRSSFYTHFTSVYDVAKDIQNETLEIFKGSLKLIKEQNDFYTYLDSVINYLKKHEEVYSMILSSENPHTFTKQLSDVVNKTIYSALTNEENEILYSKVVFFTNGCLELIIKHFRDEITMSLDEIGDLLKELLKKVFF